MDWRGAEEAAKLTLELMPPPTFVFLFVAVRSFEPSVRRLVIFFRGMEQVVDISLFCVPKRRAFFLPAKHRGWRRDDGTNSPDQNKLLDCIWFSLVPWIGQLGREVGGGSARGNLVG